MTHLTDTELVQSARTGSLEAFEELVNRHERRIYTLAQRITRNDHDAQDVTQQTFFDALRHLDSFREESAFATWITRIATYAALKIIRKRKGLPTVSLDDDRHDDDELPHPRYIADWREHPATLANRNETRALIEQALTTLDDKHRLVFLLRDVEGLSVKETAEATGLSEANVKVRLLRARLQLREKLTELFGDPATQPPGHNHE
jgi:RNA polymerase sigma-70 factor (ECF subfamily)